jgi:hypothetical protein
VWSTRLIARQTVKPSNLTRVWRKTIMNSSMIPTRLPEPPPGPKPFDLELRDGERLVGWIAPDRIAFVGFANEVEAAHAAHVAYRTVARRIAQRDGGRSVPIELEPLSLRHEGADAIVLASGRPIARLVEPGDDSRAGDAFAFELLLDAPRDELSVRAKAHLVYRTLRRSGVRWSTFRRPAAVAQVKPEPAVVPVPNVDAMRIDAPIPRKYAWASLLAFAMLFVALFAPAAIAAAIGGVALAALTVMRLTVLHARWPARGTFAGRGPQRSFLLRQQT